MSKLLRSRLAGVAAIAVAYFVAGKLGLLLAVPPGYATAVWPPSGFALVGILLLGTRCWPGVWLGSFCVNVGMGFDPSSNLAIFKSLAIAGSIGCGASMQAVLGAWLVRRFVGWPTALIRSREILSFMTIGGPVACLVGATCGVSTLLAAGILPVNAILANWSTWWVGDTLGVWIFATIGLIAFGHPREVWKKRVKSVAVPLAASFAVSIGVFWFIQKSEIARQHDAFAQRAGEQASRLALAIRADEAVVHGLASFMEASGEATRWQFRTYTAEPLRLNSGIEALTWIPLVPQASRAEFESAGRRDGLAGFQITGMADGRITRAPDRVEHFPVFFIEAMAGKESVLGFDVASNAPRLATVHQARDTGDACASVPVKLVQGNGWGVIVVVPVYDTSSGPIELHGTSGKKTAPATNMVSLRRQRLRGIVTGAFQIQNLVHSTLGVEAFKEIELRMDDATDAAAPCFVFASRMADRRSPPGVADIGWTTTIEIGGRTWRLQFSPTFAYLAGQRSLVGWCVLAGAFLFTSFLGSVLLLITGNTALMEETVALRVAELQRLNEELKTQAAERELIAFRLRESKWVLRSFFNSTAMMMGVAEMAPGVEVIRHVSDNIATAEFLGMTPEFMRGKLSSELGVPPERIRLWARAYRESERTRKPVHFEYLTSSPAGETWIYVIVSFLGVNESCCSRFSYFARDITETKRIEESRNRLVSILETTSDFVAVSDRRGKIIYLNRAGRELVGIGPEEEVARINRHDLQPTWAEEIVHLEGIPIAMLEGSWQGDTALLHRDGREIPVSQVIVAHKDENGRVQFLSTVMRDMSERKEAEEQIRASLVEKEVLLKEIHHRVKNNMQIVSSLLRLQSQYIQDPHALACFAESRDRITSMALIHERLYQSQDLAAIDFAEYVRSLVSSIFASYRPQGVAIESRVHMEPVQFSLDTAIPLGLIINELVTNCLKYAFAGREAGCLEIEVRKLDGNRYTLVVRDDGIGMPNGFSVEKAQSLGLRLVNMLATQIRGDLAYRNGTGSEFTIGFTHQSQA